MQHRHVAETPAAKNTGSNDGGKKKVLNEELKIKFAAFYVLERHRESLGVTIFFFFFFF